MPVCDPSIRSRIRHSLRAFVLAALAIGAAHAADDWKQIEPMLQKYCYDCHGGKKTKGGVDLKRLGSGPALAKEYELWNKVKDAIVAGDMPPEEDASLPPEQKQQLTKWLGHSLDEVARANAGDPGIVTIRRLTNAEYDRTIRDLTGRDYALAADFAPDGGGGEGFTNIGDVLFVSPQQLDKYFGAARKLADHATIMPGTGIVFHPQRIGLRGPAQVKAHAQQGLYVWLQQKAAPHLPKDDEPLREADYMFACWKHQHQKVPLEQLAKDLKLNIYFLANWWKHLNNTEPKSRFLDLTRVPWRALPADEKTARELIGTIAADRQSWNDPKRSGEGPQRWQQDSDGIRPYPMQAAVGGKTHAHLCFGDTADGNKGDIALVTSIEVSVSKQKLNYFDWLNKTLDETRKQAAASPPPSNLDAIKDRIAELEKVRAAYGRHPQQGRQIEPHVLAFAAPAVFTIPLPEGAHWLKADTRLDMQNPEVEEATIQWALATDQPRDVTKVMSGVLTIWKQGTPAARKTMGEFNSMKQAFADMFERRLEIVAENMHRSSPGLGVYYYYDEQLGELLGQQDKDYLAAMKKDWRLVANAKLNKQQEADFDGALLGHLHEFAQRAWRSPITEEEIKKLDALYFEGRAKELDRETAAREVLVRLLVSPKFLFKLEDAGQPGERRLTAWELATRLSYLLWSSLPDEPLRQRAADASLLKPDVLAAEVKRMLRDRRASALGEEFAAQWLHFHGFVKTANIDPKKFPEFTPELRRDMARETTEFFSHLVREDQPLREIITADYTFLNERLAKFYGIPGVTGNDFRKVSVTAHGRGGLLGMGAVLTQHSYPHRTSPVLRGHWLLASVLGLPTPPPPNDVPKLDDSVSSAKTLRARLELHRRDAACSSCHDKIDPLGFALEKFDPIGRIRAKDEAGLDIDDAAQWKGGAPFRGIDGLRGFLASRESDVTANFCRKLTGYALGRIILPTDKPLLESMQAELKKNDGRLSAAVLTLVQSRQFQNRRSE